MVNSLHFWANLYLPARVYDVQFSLTYFTMFKSILHSSTITEQNVKSVCRFCPPAYGLRESYENIIIVQRCLMLHYHRLALPMRCFFSFFFIFFILDVADDMFLFRYNGLNLVPLVFVYAPRHQNKRKSINEQNQH